MTKFEDIVNLILETQPKNITHTAGPWDVSHFCNPIDVSVTDQGLYEVEQANEEINALLDGDDYIKAQMVAESNRKLIEVAPVMIQMLKDLINHSPVDIESMRHEAKTIIEYVEGDLKKNLV